MSISSSNPINIKKADFACKPHRHILRVFGEDFL